MASITNSRIESIYTGKFPEDVLRNAAPARLYQDAVLFDGAQITSSGGLATLSGEKTGRSPKDKRVVDQPSVHDDVWWGDINVPMTDDSYDQLRSRAVEFLDRAEHRSRNALAALRSDFKQTLAERRCVRTTQVGAEFLNQLGYS